MKISFSLILFPSTDPLKETEILTKKNPTDYLPLCTGVLLTTKTALTSGSCIEQAQKDGNRGQDIGVWDRISSLQVTLPTAEILSVKKARAWILYLS